MPKLRPWRPLARGLSIVFQVFLLDRLQAVIQLVQASPQHLDFCNQMILSSLKSLEADRPGIILPLKGFSSPLGHDNFPFELVNMLLKRLAGGRNIVKMKEMSSKLRSRQIKDERTRILRRIKIKYSLEPEECGTVSGLLDRHVFQNMVGVHVHTAAKCRQSQV